MINVDTITDKQIQELRSQLARELTRALDGLDACRAAIYHGAKHPNDPDYPTSVVTARARCAEILNARNSSPSASGDSTGVLSPPK